MSARTQPKKQGGSLLTAFLISFSLGTLTGIGYALSRLDGDSDLQKRIGLKEGNKRKDTQMA